MEGERTDTSLGLRSIPESMVQAGVASFPDRPLK